MKRIKILYASALVALSFFGAGCNDSESDLLTSKLYFESNVIRVEVEADTYDCELISRLSNMMKSDVKVSYQIGGQDLVDEYNQNMGRPDSFWLLITMKCWELRRPLRQENFMPIHVSC